MGGGEGFDLPVVFLWQHRAGDVDQLTAGPDIGSSLSQRLLLLFDPLLQIAVGQPPFGIGPAPPGAGAGAGGIDQHLVEPSSQRLQGGDPVMDLNIMGACSFQPLDDRRQPLAVAIIGVNLTFIAHGGCHSQRLATAACAEIQHLMTFRRFDQRRDDLRPSS